MAKRILCLVLILFSLSLPAGAFCEEAFTLHAGTTFGMTVEEVVAAEAAKNSIELEEPGIPYGRKKVFLSGKLAGLEHGEIEYYFDDSGKLYMMKYVYHLDDYELNDHNIYNTMLDEFNTLMDLLKNKYGEPGASQLSSGFLSFTNQGTPYNIPAQKNDIIINHRQNVANHSDQKRTYTWAEWIVDDADSHVFIQNIQVETLHSRRYTYSSGHKSILSDWHTIVTYLHIDNETYSKIMNQQNNASDDI